MGTQIGRQGGVGGLQGDQMGPSGDGNGPVKGLPEAGRRPESPIASGLRFASPEGGGTAGKTPNAKLESQQQPWSGYRIPETEKQGTAAETGIGLLVIGDWETATETRRGVHPMDVQDGKAWGGRNNIVITGVTETRGSM